MWLCWQSCAANCSNQNNVISVTEAAVTAGASTPFAAATGLQPHLPQPQGLPNLKIQLALAVVPAAKITAL